MSGRDTSSLGRPARPTMKDVAALAGVAIKTVSRVMNGEPTVAPDLAARVHGAADKLGYRPNLTASSLRRGDRRTATIGLLLEDVSNPFSAALLRAVEDQARERRGEGLIGGPGGEPVRARERALTLVHPPAARPLLRPPAPAHRVLLRPRRGPT